MFVNPRVILIDYDCIVKLIETIECYTKKSMTA